LGCGKNNIVDANINTFLGWDFDTLVWKICDGTNYPKLAWKIPLAGDFGCPVGVDIYDLAKFSSEWLATNNPASNLNGDEIVNLSDFTIFAENWMKE
jgi:hypothetical protein